MAGKSNRIRIARLIGVVAAGAGGIAMIALINLFFRTRVVDSAAMSARDTFAQVANLDRQQEYPLDEVLQMARDALANLHANVRDYTAVLEKQERVRGKLSDVTRIELKIMHAPLSSPQTDQASETPPDDAEIDGEADSAERSVSQPTPFRLHAYFHFLAPPGAAGREVIYVEGANNGNLIAHEGGFKNFLRIPLDPEGPVAMLGNKYPANRVGLENLLRKLIEKGLRDRAVPGCSVEIQEDFSWHGIPARKIVVIHPRPTANVDFHRAEIVIDPQRKVPLSFASYLWPEKPGDPPPLEESYSYHDLKLNVGLTADDFDPDNEAYNYP